MSAALRRLWLTRLAGGAALLLVGVTWPLWRPPTPESFPQLPLFGWLIPAPAWCDRAALGGVLLGAFGMIWGGSSKNQELKNQNDSSPGSEQRSRAFLVLDFLVLKLPRLAPTLFTASLAFALALNQIRLQVWAYQFLLLGAVLSLCPRTETGDRAAVTLARALAVGILFHSALSKLDLAFAEGPGTWLMGGFLGLFGVDPNGVPHRLRSAAAFAVPAWELGLAILLAVPSLRRVGLLGAAFMHAALMATLWRLSHSWGVLLWNGFFLAHEFLLFWPNAKGESVPIWSVLRTTGPRAWPAAALIAAAVTLPFGTRSGYWDVWPGWAVYAGGPGGSGWVRLPGRRAQTKNWPAGSYRPLNLSRRALGELHVPVPDDWRVTVGLTLAAAARGDAWFAGEPDRADPGVGTPRVYLVPVRGRMERSRTPSGRSVAGWKEVNAFADAFLLNARPRALSLPPEAR